MTTASQLNQLYHAIQRDDTHMVISYLGKKEDINSWLNLLKTQQDANTIPFICWASARGHNDVIEHLLKIGDDINTIANTKTPLIYAIMNDRRTTADLLIKAGADVNYIHPSCNSALYNAAQMRDMKTCAAIIEKLDDPSQETATFGLICMYADLFPLYAQMAARGVDMGRMTASPNDIPLSLAIKNKNDCMVDALINEKNLDVNIINDNGSSPLYHAIQYYPDKPYLTKLIDKKCGLQDRNVYNHILTRPALLPVMEKMIAGGGQPEKIVYGDGMTFLHKAVNEQNERLVELLIARHANVNAITNEKQLPLHLAVRKGNARIIQALIDAGSSLHEKNNGGHTPLSLARSLGNLPNSTITYLREATEGNLPPSKPKPAVLPNANDNDAEDSYWQRLDGDSVARVCNHAFIEKRITDIFNFRSHDRVTIIDDIRMKQQSVMQRESFNDIEAATLQNAFDAYVKLEGKITREQAIANYPQNQFHGWTK